MKRVCSILTVAVVLATAAWAQDFSISAGGGGFGVADFTGGYKDDTEGRSLPYFGGGAFIFFDATYGEVSVGYFVGGGDTVEKGSNIPTTTTPWTLSGLNLGVFLKYPFELSDIVTLSPMAGADYQMILSAKMDEKTETSIKNSTEEAPGDLSALWIKGGVGIDLHVFYSLYFHGEVLFGVRLASKWEKDWVDTRKGGKTNLGIGPTVKLGVGYRFY
ncbi:MAG: hypothetical protein LBT00_02075 [Spirochaetaceae bacterium]|jgi:hypothetical protein|nr:hypothetical protein [Spirochaetaceae bacterium]